MVNQWFAGAAAVHLLHARQEEERRAAEQRSLGGVVQVDDGPTAAVPPWALVLDTASLATVRALERSGAVAKERCVVPNPDPAVVGPALFAPPPRLERPQPLQHAAHQGLPHIARNVTQGI